MSRRTLKATAGSGKSKGRLREKVGGTYEGDPASKPEVESLVMTIDWPTFYAAIQKDITHGFKDRLAMLEQVASHFTSAQRSNDIPLQARLGIAVSPYLTRLLAARS